MTASIVESGDSVPPSQDAAASCSADQGETSGRFAVFSRRDLQECPPMPSPWRRPVPAILWVVRAMLGLVCLLGLLAVVAAIPVANLFVLGYLMEIQGRVARTGKVRSAFFLLPAAQRLGAILLAVWLWLLPIHFLAGAARDSWLLAPGGAAVWLTTSLLVVASLLIATHLLLAIGCGGGGWRFVRPLSNARWLTARWRRAEYWRDANHALCEFVAAFRLPQLLQLGLLGYATVYIWVVIPTILFTMLDDVTSTWQFAGFLLGALMLTVALLWLPLLLVHVAAAGRWTMMSEFATVVRLAGRTPFCWSLVTAILFACSTMPLLYTALFKIQIPPHDARWDMMLVFLVTVAPARVAVGWVYHRATQQSRGVPSRLWQAWQWANGTALWAGVGCYVYFLNLAATGGELGERAVWQFHSLLLPFPF